MSEAKPQTKRTDLTSAERRALLDEYDSYPRGDSRRGELLRRHGLYTSQLAKWRQRLKQGDTALDSRPPGPVPQPVNPLAAELARLQRENTRLQSQLANAEAVIAIQKKVAALLDALPTQPLNEPS